MRYIFPANALLFAFLLTLPSQPEETPKPHPRRNIILFVADGMRRGSINAVDTPAFWSLRQKGVDFQNSHALFPTLTMTNASAIATGHGLGDTGVFSNTIWVGYPLLDTRNFDVVPASPVPFIENDQVLGDIDDHYRGNYLGEETLLQLAHENGYQTAAVGKVGPTAIQDAAVIRPVDSSLASPPATFIVDDATGTPAGLPLTPALVTELRKADLSLEAPGRSNGYAITSPYSNGFAGDNSRPGTVRPNLVQQQWFADVTTQAILPLFARHTDEPFALLFWSRDPDGTQHNQGDSLGALYPGINGKTSLAAVRNADRNLRQILDWLDAYSDIKANTDVFVTSDHGFATISRREIDRTAHITTSEAAKHCYFDANGKAETEKGTLPLGFLAIDLAVGLKTNLFDPDHRPDSGRKPFRQVRLSSDTWERPVKGNGLLGPDILKPDGSDAMAIVTSNGGSDLIYVPNQSENTARQIVSLLLTFDYVGGVFIDDRYGPLAGTLPLSAIGLTGSGALPRPAIAVAFRVFYLDPADLQSAKQISDTPLQEGQGMHGGFGRDSTYNNMAAIGPDFKTSYVDSAPVSNADILPTLAKVIGLPLVSKGKLQGRIMDEALAGGKEPHPVVVKRLASPPANGLATAIVYQEFEGTRYIDAACLAAPERSQHEDCQN